MHNSIDASPLRRPAAVMLVVTTLVSLLALAHHPGSTLRPATAHDGLVAIDSFATPLAIMHGTMIALYAVLAACHAVFAATLDWKRAPVLLGMATYLAGYGLMVGAALLDGFVTPQLAHLYLAAPETRALQVNVALAAISVGIQVLTKAGLLAMSLAFIAFGGALATGASQRRGLAAIAIVAGALPPCFMLASGLWLGPSSLALLFAPQGVWHFGMAWALYEKKAARRLLQEDPAVA